MSYQIVWRGVVHDSTGYARAARESCLALDALGCDVKIEPMNLGTSPAGLAMDAIERIQTLINKPLSNGKKVLIFHHPPFLCDPAVERKVYDKLILNTLWETTKLPATWFPNVTRFDRIIAPSTWIKSVMQANNVTTPIDIAMFGTDTGVFAVEDGKMILQMSEEFKFLSVGTWQHRKGFDLLLRAFWEEFRAWEGVCLILKTYLAADNGWANMKIRESIRKMRQHGTFTDAAPVYVTTEDLNDAELVTLYNACDSMVLPSRGEGVGLPYLEAMRRGKPVVAVNYGGQEDFLTPENCYLVDHCIVPVPVTTAPAGCIAPHPANLYGPGMMWAEADIASLRQQMRMVFTDRDASRAKGEKGKLDTEQLTWAASAQAIKGAVEAALES